MVKKAWRMLWRLPIFVVTLVWQLFILISYGPKTQGEITRALQKAIDGLPVRIKADKSGDAFKRHHGWKL